MVSKFGKRVEEILAQPPVEVDIQEKITLEAQRLEIEQICGYISAWAKKRLGRTFYGAAIHVRYDMAMDWYELAVDFRRQGKVYSVREYLRSEDIDRAATSTQAWTVFLDKRCEVIKQRLRTDLLQDGVTELPLANRTGIKMTGNGSTFEATARRASKSIADLGKNMSTLSEQMRRVRDQEMAVNALEEQAAIDSIKRTIEDQAE